MVGMEFSHPTTPGKATVMNLSTPARTPSTRPPARRFVAALLTGALSLTLAATSAPAAGAAAPSFCPDESQPYATVAEVEAFAAGTAVTGLSVTQGTSPDPFTGTYIGHLADALGKDKDMLLFRLSSPVIDGTGGLKPAGIWAGMSGSPVYTTDGKLIGAVAYSLNFDNLPIAGVTPAEYMKNIGTTVVGTSAKVRVTSANLRTSDAGISAAGTSLVGATLSQVRTVNVAGAAGTKANAFANRTLARTPKTAKSAAVLRSRTFLPAAAVRPASVPEPLVAGGSIAVLYGSGDLVAGSIGTVTAICTDTVWAFGHPMGYVGRTSLFMANASTALIVPDATGTYGSYKQVSEFGAPVGMITQDRSAGVRGTLGATESFGIGVAIQNPSGTEVDRYHGDLASQDLTAAAVGYLVGKAASEQLDQYNAGTGEVSWTISFRREDGSAGGLSNTQVVANRYWFPDEVATPPANDAAAITENEYEDVTITGVEVTLKLLSEDSLTYRASGIQVQRKSGTWKPLDGATLSAGSAYTLRPEYTLKTNGKTSGTEFGTEFRSKLPAKARKFGWFDLIPAAGSGEECEVIDDVEICVDFGQDTDGYGDFDQLLAELDELPLNSSVLGELTYRRKKSYGSKSYQLTGPGVVTGGSSAGFTIRS